MNRGADGTSTEQDHGALLTDLYQLTMLSSYFERGMDETAVFEFFVRRLPERRNFLIAAGLEQLLEYLEGLRFTPEEIGWLEATGRFQRSFLDWLARLRFEGNVDAMREGTVFFAGEPLVRVTAPLSQAQLVETRLINLLHFQTVIASKAARCVLAARGRTLVDFGLRRAHGAEAGILASRAAYLAGFGGTATVAAGRRFNIPLYGTMAHSFVQAHTSEIDAFRHFARSFPTANTLLIDTYDTLRAAQRVVELARELRPSGIRIQAVRIDSGELGSLARGVRRILDAGGCGDTQIFLSGSLDELTIEQLLAEGTPADGFGVGTSLDVAADHPWLDCAYKLQEYAGRPTRKRSAGKATWPGRKQVMRRVDADGTLMADEIALQTDVCRGEPLIVPVMRAGRRSSPRPTLDESRDHARAEISRLPLAARSLSQPFNAPVEIAPSIVELASALDRADQGPAAPIQGIGG
ncbi:MAG TPA: nicotinate phosphoribosyltransferase [Steroidobacteraceae bacterium]